MSLRKLTVLQQAIKGCQLCKGVVPPVVTGNPMMSKVYLLGQAPGVHEGRLGRPFAYTAGKTMFKWFASMGVDEDTFRLRVYMAAVLRCFPGKALGGGDRVPSTDEIHQCRGWIAQEVALLKPQLIIPVGRIAIEQVLGEKLKTLDTIVGKQLHISFQNCELDCIPLPHPSGASTWHRREPGKTLLTKALGLISKHPAWQDTFS